MSDPPSTPSPLTRRCGAKVRQGDDVFVSLRAVCSALGLDHAGQGVKLAKREWATVAIIATVGADGRDRERRSLACGRLRMWPSCGQPLTYW